VNDFYNQNQSEGDASSIQIPRWKRGLDIFLILLVLPLVLPLAVLIGIFIMLVSPGPILFRQERVGLLGRRFMCLKFRTMFVRAETASHEGYLSHLMDSNAPMQKLDNRGDSRIIPFGWLLRSSGLDELPQLINVLRGEMSLVGPRPCLPYESDKYLPWQRERFNTLPGLTGLWQVSGKNRTTFNEMMQLDIRYSRSKTLWMDLVIIFKTVPAMIGQMVESRLKKRAAAQSNVPLPASVRTGNFAVSGIERISRKNQPESLPWEHSRIEL
jgi:lipopolysaccharide/colanic/teichoic acid biosynthesis glycosyltransferase